MFNSKFRECYLGRVTSDGRGVEPSLECLVCSTLLSITGNIRRKAKYRFYPLQAIAKRDELLNVSKWWEIESVIAQMYKGYRLTIFCLSVPFLMPFTRHFTKTSVWFLQPDFVFKIPNNSVTEAKRKVFFFLGNQHVRNITDYLFLSSSFAFNPGRRRWGTNMLSFLTVSFIYRGRVW